HVDAHIVRIVAELDAAARREILAAIEVNRAVARIGDIERVSRRKVADALRLREADDAMNHRAGLEVDDADAVIAKLGDEEALTREVDGEVVDPAFDRAERDLCFEDERRLRGRSASC